MLLTKLQLANGVILEVFHILLVRECRGFGAAAQGPRRDLLSNADECFGAVSYVWHLDLSLVLKQIRK